MYSMILMATLTTPATTLDCHKRNCTGGCSGSYASCTGGCYGSCSGCYGSRSSCYGSTCYGSCYGSTCSGYSSCSGSCSGCYGSAYYYTGSCFGGHSCYGCAGSGCSGTPHASNYVPSYEQPAVPAQPGTTKTSYNASPAPARVSISLPADAKLYVDGQLTKTADKSIRTFLTPDLEEGQEYRYVMKAEVVRDGIAQSETKTVIVRAGGEVREEFSTLNTEIRTASNR